MGKKSADADRQARVEKMRAEQAATERRRTLLVAVAALTVVAVLVGLVTWVIRDYRQENPDELALIGAPAASAGCDDVISEETSGASDHVAAGTRIDYATVPPSSGSHLAAPQFPASASYTAEDRPAMEALVHNLEHGYTVAWYTDALPEDQLDQLKRISTVARDDSSTSGKFIVSSWDDSYGEFPAGKTVALAHWGAEEGHRQLCDSVSGEVVESFITEFPYTDSPEPNGQ